MNVEFPSSLRIHLPIAADLVDEAIVERALLGLFRGTFAVQNQIRMTVLQGQVTLSGDVASEGERTAIGNTVGTMPGVVGVTNLVTIRPECPDPDRTEALFEWDTDTGGTEIRIIVMDGRITVLGKVSSSRERDLAERIVQAASGITKVDNRVIWRLL